MKKMVALLMCLLMVVAAFAGCAAPAAPAAAEPAAAPAAEAEAPANKELLITMVCNTPAEANCMRCINGAKDAAAELGWTVEVIDAQGSADIANSAIQNAVTKGSDMIVEMVFPTTSLASGLAAAKEAGIPLASWGGGLGAGMDDGVWFTNGSGGPHAIPIVEKMCEDLGGEGEVLALTYSAGQVAREREAELDKVLANYPNIKVTKNEVRIPGYLQDGADYAAAWLASRPAGSGNYAIWGCWDEPSVGAIATLKQMDRNDVKVYGENGNVAAILAIQEGWMRATAWQDSYSEGRQLVETFKEIMDLGADPAQWTAVEKAVAPIVIDTDTVAAFVAEHPESIEE